MDLETKTVVQLKDICRERKIKGYSQLQKRPLINLIKKDTKKSDKSVGKRDVFLDTKNFVFDSKLRPFAKIYKGELKKLSPTDISFLKDKGYTVLEVDVSAADDVIFDIGREEYCYGYESDESPTTTRKSSDSQKSPKSQKRMVKAKPKSQRRVSTKYKGRGLRRTP
uniref:Rho termination factor n=1 Tax=Marseillevirus LCMAC101 TaxID=2506602 RepID=A0A481YTL6_9VIRU|nr:MAG: Rho termination factor [Marseillevirus LCMAC101]